MKRLFNILSFLLLLFLLTAEDCSDSSIEVTREEKQSELFQSIENEFLVDELTPEILSAFEKRAIQKLNDLSDFINIYADTSLCIEFRLQASQMITKSFRFETDLQNYYQCFSFVADTTREVISYSENSTSFYTEIESVIITDSFQKRSNSGYSGVLQFSQTIFKLSDRETILFTTSKRQLEILAIKTKKEFGTNSAEVWEVHLGGLK